MSPRSGRGMPLAMCTRPSTPNSSAAQPMTCRPAGPLLLGVAQVAPGDEAQQQRHEPAQQADRAVDDGAHGVADASGQLPPHGRGRPRPRPRSGTARPRRAGARARARGRCGRPCGPLRPGRGRHRARWRRHPARGRVRARQWGQCRCGRLAVQGGFDFAVERPFGAGLLRDWLPDDRVEDPDPFEPARAAGLEVPLFRDAGGEDVRVAMLANLHRCHSSPRPHTPGRGTPTWAVHGGRPIAGSVRPMSHPHLELSAAAEAAQGRPARRRPGRPRRDRPQHDGLRARRQAADRRLRRAVPRGAPARHRRDPPRLHLDPGPARRGRRASCSPTATRTTSAACPTCCASARDIPRRRLAS